uniref:Uncharacterized protein n=1 Tax=Phocoena sinus TaxID=42100 RepID=A0A8C9C4Z0_PHOSS
QQKCTHVACVCVCARVCVRLWSSGEGPEPQGGRKAADCTPWMTPGCSPRFVFLISQALCVQEKVLISVYRSAPPVGEAGDRML